MDKKNKLLLFITLLLTLSIVLTLYSFLRPGKAPAPVILVYQDHEYNYTDGKEPNRFWDNYPYQVLLSQHRAVDSLLPLVDAAGQPHTLQEVLKQGDCTIFRYSLLKQVPAVLDTTLAMIRQSGAPVILLTDDVSKRMRPLSSAYTDKVPLYTLQDKLPLCIDREELCYFFSVGKDFKTQDIYVPRPELPELTWKYLASRKTLYND